MENILQIIASFMGAAGFALIFNVHGRKIIWIGLGGALSWIVYLLTKNLTGSEFVSLMVATMAIVASSEILARVIKAPIIMLIVPMLIPMVPGGTLYYTMSYFIRDDNAMLAESLRSLLVQAGAIAAGIIIMTSVMTNFFAIFYRSRGKRAGK